MKKAKTSKTEQARPALGRKPLFRKEHVIKAALDLMDRSGHKALSMRAIAAELGTGVATLYNYFDSLASLNDELALTLLDGIPLIDAKGAQQARQQLKDLVIAYAKVAERHPSIDQMVGPHTYQRILELLNSALRAMVDAGVDIERAGIMWSILQSLAQSHATSSRRFGSVRQPEMSKMVKGLDAVMTLAGTGYLEASLEERFSLVLDVILDRIVPELKGKATNRRAGGTR
jgi:AcrR family transcriptional regulator